MILLVGLGNPGAQYQTTRHNAGFIMLDALAREFNIAWQGSKFEADFGRGRLLDETVLILKPQTFMNLSGKSVAQAMNFFKVPSSSMIVLHDDIDVPPGKVRARFGGSHGGNNGIRSLLECLGTDQFHRVKLGVGKSQYPDGDSANWVLGTMSPAELEAMRGPMYQEVLVRIENIFKTIRAT